MDDKQNYVKRTLLLNALKNAEEHFLLHQQTFKLTMTETMVKIETYDMSVTIQHRKDLCGCR
jgi:hypothetical protein